MSLNTPKKPALREDISSLPEFLGRSPEQICADGVERKRVYFDSAATALPFKAVQEAATAFLNVYGSTHSSGHLAGKLAFELENWSREQILSYLDAPVDEYDVTFIGWGATAALNRLAAGLNSMLKPKASSVLISMMEHHSNDLPHRHFSESYLHIPILSRSSWNLDLEALESMLKQSKGRVGYVALTASSNVTGLVNPIRKAAKICHQYNALILVDGAQSYAHMPISLKGGDGDDIDLFVFSGHKSHAMSSPGVIVAKKSILEKMPPFMFGGGMVDEVTQEDFSLSNTVFKREAAGTSNALGIYGIGVATRLLSEIGIHRISAHEVALRKHAISALSKVPNIRLYAERSDADSLGVVPFNIAGVPHALLGQILNDYFAIAVRTGCFCAHPYVRELLVKDFIELDYSEEDIDQFQGMVRISFGLYNTFDDINYLIDSLIRIESEFEHFSAQYDYDPASKSFCRKDSKQFESYLISFTR